MINTLPRYPVQICLPRGYKYKIKLCKLIRLPAIDIPVGVYLFVFELPIINNKKSKQFNLNNQKIKKLWENYKQLLINEEKSLKIPILTWKNKEMFNYFLRKSTLPYSEDGKEMHRYILQLKINWDIFLNYLEI